MEVKLKLLHRRKFSCFLMVILTAFRLRNVCNAYNPSMLMNPSLLPWKLSVGTAWLMSFFLSIIPNFNVTSQYFVHSISFSSVFHKERTWEVATLKQFMYRYALLSNSTLPNNENHLESIDMFLRSRFPEGGTIFNCLDITVKPVSVCLESMLDLGRVLGNTHFFLSLSTFYACFSLLLATSSCTSMPLVHQPKLKTSYPKN